MTPAYKRSYDQEIAICALAQKGTEKKILNTMCLRRKEIVGRFFIPLEAKPRAGKGGWSKGLEGRLAADRLLNLFITMYGRIKLDRQLDAVSLLNLHLAYQAIYPNFEMHPNRIHYFLPQLKQQQIIMYDKCSDCGRPYCVYHDEDADVCASCTIQKAAQHAGDNEFYVEPDNDEVCEAVV